MNFKSIAITVAMVATIDLHANAERATFKYDVLKETVASPLASHIIKPNG